MLRSSFRPLALLGALLCALPASAQLGASVYVQTTGEVVARFEGHTAGYSSALFLDQALIGPIFPNQTTPVGTTFSLGTFAAGTELIFRLHVYNTGDNWYTGPAGRNADGFAHANVVYNWNGTGRTFVGFEDLFNLGDRDYDDHMFSFTNVSTVQVPAPAALLPFAAGLLRLRMRRR